ncbi:hypothetical protein [Bradyrhizobium liaoningense]
MTDQDTTHIVREAVKEFLLALGVDVTTPGSVIELQKDFHHVRHTRLTMGAVRREVGSKFVSALTASAVTGAIAVVTFYFTTKGH